MYKPYGVTTKMLTKLTEALGGVEDQGSALFRPIDTTYALRKVRNSPQQVPKMEEELNKLRKPMLLAELCFKGKMRRHRNRGVIPPPVKELWKRWAGALRARVELIMQETAADVSDEPDEVAIQAKEWQKTFRPPGMRSSSEPPPSHHSGKGPERDESPGDGGSGGGGSGGSEAPGDGGSGGSEALSDGGSGDGGSGGGSGDGSDPQDEFFGDLGSPPQEDDGFPSHETGDGFNPSQYESLGDFDPPLEDDSFPSHNTGGAPGEDGAINTSRVSELEKEVARLQREAEQRELEYSQDMAKAKEQMQASNQAADKRRNLAEEYQDLERENRDLKEKLERSEKDRETALEVANQGIEAVTKELKEKKEKTAKQTREMDRLKGLRMQDAEIIKQLKESSKLGPEQLYAPPASKTAEALPTGQEPEPAQPKARREKPKPTWEAVVSEEIHVVRDRPVKIDYPRTLRTLLPGRDLL